MQSCLGCRSWRQSWRLWWRMLQWSRMWWSSSRPGTFPPCLGTPCQPLHWGSPRIYPCLLRPCNNRSAAGSHNSWWDPGTVPVIYSVTWPGNTVYYNNRSAAGSHNSWWDPGTVPVISSVTWPGNTVYYNNRSAAGSHNGIALGPRPYFTIYPSSRPNTDPVLPGQARGYRGVRVL